MSESVIEGQHPDYTMWSEDETRMRATYHALRRLMVPYLVAHRFEKGEGADLRRAKYGYAPKLNGSWVGELMGHVRGAVARYTWGDLESLDESELQRREGAGQDAITDRPAGGAAMTLWDDATLDGVPWRKFFGNKVLEWGLTSPGGFVLVDSPDIPGEMTQLEEARAGRRPYVRFVPMSRVVDLGTGGFGFGFRYIEFQEDEDGRKPRGKGDDESQTTTLLYELDDAGRTHVTRRDEDGNTIGKSTDLGEPFKDPQGFPVLPLIPAMFGEHPEITFVGEGLLLGLDDVVIDIFNLLSEVREGFRDGCFTVHQYRGHDYQTALDSMQNGSRLVDLGGEAEANLERLEGGLAEVEGGLSLITLALQAWAVGAKRKAAEAMERAEGRSGVSLKAEFQLDSRPLLTEIAEWLDQVETNTMWVVAQMAGLDAKRAQEVGVSRDTTFQMEDEASRIARIVGEFTTSLPVPATMAEAITLRWAEATDLVDMDSEVALSEGGVETVREALRREAREIAEARQRGEVERGDLFRGFGLPNIADDIDEAA